MVCLRKLTVHTEQVSSKQRSFITTGTGTTPQSTYNPLPVSTCGCNCGR